MRVLVVHCNYRSESGEHVVVTRQRDALANAGHDVGELFFDNPKTTIAATKALVRAPWNASSALEVIDKVHEFEPDVVHVNNTWFAGSPSVTAALDEMGIPTVITFHNYRFACVKATMFRDGKNCDECVGGSTLPAIRHSCYHGSFTKTAVGALTLRNERKGRQSENRWYVAPSQHVADVAIQAGVPMDRIRTVPHFAPDTGPRPAPPSEASSLLFVGRLDRGKGVTKLLDRWAELESDYSLDLVGGGPTSDAVRASLPAKAYSMGWRTSEEVQKRMRTSRALVFPSEWQEPFGLVLVEALAAGLPIIGLDVSAVKTIAGEAGDLIYAANDDDWLKVAVERIGDDGFVDDLSRRSRSRFVAQYTERVHVERLESLYQEAIDGCR